MPPSPHRRARTPATLWATLTLTPILALLLWAGLTSGDRVSSNGAAWHAIAYASDSDAAPVPEVEEEPECILLLTDGQRVTGRLIAETDEHIIVRIAGFPTEFPRSRVERLRVLEPVLVRYERMRAGIDDGDIERLITLVEWLHARRAYDAALEELEHILEVEPGNSRARQLRVLVERHKAAAERDAQHELERGQQRQPERPRPNLPRLTNEQINRVKVFEVDLDNPPRLVIPPSVIDELIERYGDTDHIPSTREGREALYRKPAREILEIIFKVRARDLYGKVQVLDHPRSMIRFRDQVHRPWLMNSCATNRCHGGEEAGNLRLHNRRVNSDATLYTNLLILDRYRLKDGTPLINYDEPHRSPLLQMAITRSNSARPHPEFDDPALERAFRPPFRSTDDERFQQAVRWIRSMYRPRPDYDIADEDLFPHLYEDPEEEPEQEKDDPEQVAPPRHPR